MCGTPKEEGPTGKLTQPEQAEAGWRVGPLWSSVVVNLYLSVAYCYDKIPEAINLKSRFYLGSEQRLPSEQAGGPCRPGQWGEGQGWCVPSLWLSLASSCKVLGDLIHLLPCASLPSSHQVLQKMEDIFSFGSLGFRIRKQGAK